MRTLWRQIVRLAAPRTTSAVNQFRARPSLEALEHRVVPAVIQVGPTRAVTTLAQAGSVAHTGDDVRIDAGTYTGTGILVNWTQSNLKVEAVGGPVVLDATGLSISNRKGIFTVSGTNTTINGIEFMGAHDTVGLDKNWAGIRMQGTTLTVNHCKFFNNDDGMLVNAGATSDITVKYSEFGHNGYGDGYSHNMYIGNVRSFTLEYSYTHDANVGHDVKSRANTNTVEYNWIGDTGNGSASYELSFPNGGTAYVIGNVLHKDQHPQNPVLLDWGSEGASNPSQGVYVVNNTLVNDYTHGQFIRLTGGTGTPVVIENNIFAGAGLAATTLYTGPTAQMVTNLSAVNPGFVDAAHLKYGLTAGSAAVNAGTTPGTANGVSLIPQYEYFGTASRHHRPVVGQIDIGAFEYA